MKIGDGGGCGTKNNICGSGTSIFLICWVVVFILSMIRTPTTTTTTTAASTGTAATAAAATTVTAVSAAEAPPPTINHLSKRR